jgi:hypothetical protein
MSITYLTLHHLHFQRKTQFHPNCVSKHIVSQWRGVAS